MQKLRCELAEATAAIEEVNRIRGLARALGQCATHGLNYLELARQILADVQAHAPADGSCFAYFPGAAAGANAPADSES